MPWFVLSSVYIAAYDAVQIPPSNDYTQRDSTFVDPLDVVASPGDSIWNTRVYAHSAQERSSILDTRGFSTKKHGKAGDPNQRCADVTKPSLTCPVRDITDSYGHDRCSGIRWYRQELLNDEL